MHLIIILLSLALEHFYPHLSHLRKDNFLVSIQAWWAKYFSGTSLWRPSLAVVLGLVPIIVLIILVRLLLASLLFGFLGYIFDVIVLWYLLRNEEKTASDNEEIVGDYQSALFWRAHEQRFAILFWYCVLGIWAAALYRLLTVLQEHAQPEDNPYHFALPVIAQWHGVLAWLPARVTALSYALVGNFVPAFSCWQQQAWQRGESFQLLINCGEAALDEREDSAAQLLIKRASLLWLLVLALMTIGALM